MKRKTLWAVMKAHTWDSISVGGFLPLRCPPEGPHKFIPVFDTKRQAIAWAGSNEHVVMLQTVTRLTNTTKD